MRHVFLTALAGVLMAAPAQAQPYRGYLPPARQDARIRAEDPERLARYWYRSYLRREAHPAEIRQMADMLRRGQPIDVLASLLGGREYYDYCGRTPDGFINQLILDVGHHEPSLRELREQMHRYRGHGRRDIAYSFLREHPQNWIPGLPASVPEDPWDDWHDWR